MKILIAGSRTFNDYDLLSKSIIESGYNISEIIHGGAIGADQLAQKYAHENNIPTKIFRPKYENFPNNPKYAPLARNLVMVDYCDAAILFWDGKSKGTEFTANALNNSGTEWLYIKI